MISVYIGTGGDDDDIGLVVGVVGAGVVVVLGLGIIAILYREKKRRCLRVGDIIPMTNKSVPTVHSTR